MDMDMIELSNTVCFFVCILIGTYFFRSCTYTKPGTDTTLPAFCIKLDKVHNLRKDTQMQLRKHLMKNKSIGIHNFARRFEVKIHWTEL